MTKIVYCGPFKKDFQDYIDLKRAIGYKYETEAKRLECFDKFTIQKYPLATTLTKEIVLDWCSKKSHETQQNQCIRASSMRQFGIYLDSLGVNSYILPKNYYPATIRYIPHIYTIDELKRFFAQTDQCNRSRYPNRHLIMPVIFRMLYMCGLRASEARLLKVSDVNLVSGIITINNSKNDNSRLVPMANSLLKRCQDYSNIVHCNSKENDYYFPVPNGNVITKYYLYRNFRQLLWQARISHVGRGNGPRIHDFRHTYAVHCLKNWVEQQKDLNTYLPILKTYMGHYLFAETAYYLRMTAEVFPDIIINLESKYSQIIPELEGEFDETN